MTLALSIVTLAEVLETLSTVTPSMLASADRTLLPQLLAHLRPESSMLTVSVLAIAGAAALGVSLALAEGWSLVPASALSVFSPQDGRNATENAARLPVKNIFLIVFIVQPSKSKEF